MRKLSLDLFVSSDHINGEQEAKLYSISHLHNIRTLGPIGLCLLRSEVRSHVTI